MPTNWVPVAAFVVFGAVAITASSFGPAQSWVLGFIAALILIVLIDNAAAIASGESSLFQQLGVAGASQVAQPSTTPATAKLA